MIRLRAAACQIAVMASFVTTWSAEPVTSKLIGGGEVSIVRDAEVWRVTVTGPAAGLASLCLADDKGVRILHASAAVGEGLYERSGDTWALVSGFDFKVRDKPKTPKADAERDAFFETKGWLANADNSGTRPREFIIRHSETPRWLGVTFFTTSEPMAVSYWPESMDDDCRAKKVAKGYLDPTAQFHPERWHPLK
jgi:hypothetical protein